MRFINDYFYVDNANDTQRYLWFPGRRQISSTGEVIMIYGADLHWTRTITISPSADRIYVSIGSASDIDGEDLPEGSVQQASFDDSNQKTFAFGH